MKEVRSRREFLMTAAGAAACCGLTRAGTANPKSERGEAITLTRGRPHALDSCPKRGLSSCVEPGVLSTARVILDTSRWAHMRSSASCGRRSGAM